MQTREHALELARKHARTFIDKDVLSRRWMAERGGAYVETSDRVQPNPYLEHMAERDIELPSGKRLTLVNPAYMTRQLHEMGAAAGGLRGHITSRNPIRHENAADPWETAALLVFERGIGEVSSLEKVGGEPTLRLIRPLIIEESCVSCHRVQGLELGDVSGGISVSVPFRFGWAHVSAQVFGFGAVWLLGLAGLGWGSRRLQQGVRERDRAQETVERLGQVVDDAPTEIYILNIETLQFIQANERARQNLGCTLEELRSMTVFDLVPAMTPEMLRAKVEGLLAGEQERLQFESVHKRKDGSTYPVELSVHLSSHESEPVFVAMAEDLTQRRLAEHESKLLRNQLQHAQRLESLGRLAGGVAHDFNNLLTVIISSAELGLMKSATDNALRETLLQIKAAAFRGAAVTGQLLAVSRKQIINAKVIDLNAVIDSCGRLLRPIIGEDVELLVDEEAGLPSVSADEGHMDQVLVNLAVNARDAMPRGGKLTIATAAIIVGDDNVDIPPGPYSTLSVTDTGEGMDAETQENIFEPFFTTKGSGKGTGLGLAMVHGIIKQHGGAIEVESEPGEGSKFTIYLPSVSETADKPAPSPVAEELSTGMETLLVAEDEDAVRAVTTETLRKVGYHVLEAANGREALEVARDYDGEITLLLTDVVMPEMNGRQLAERLLEARPDIETLFMSGYSGEVIARHGKLPKGVELLSKPFTTLELTDRVRAILDR